MKFQKPKILEKDIQKQIVDYLRCLGIYVKEIKLGGMTHTKDGITFQKKNSMAGFPDLLVIYQQKVFFIEVKTKTGKLSPLQKAEIDALKSQGQNAGIVRSFDDFLDVMHGWLKL